MFAIASDDSLASINSNRPNRNDFDWDNPNDARTVQIHMPTANFNTNSRSPPFYPVDCIALAIQYEISINVNDNNNGNTAIQLLSQRRTPSNAMWFGFETSQPSQVTLPFSSNTQLSQPMPAPLHSSADVDESEFEVADSRAVTFARRSINAPSCARIVLRLVTDAAYHLFFNDHLILCASWNCDPSNIGNGGKFNPGTNNNMPRVFEVIENHYVENRYQMPTQKKNLLKAR